MCLWQALVGPGLNGTPALGQLFTASLRVHHLTWAAACGKKSIQPPTAALHATILRHTLKQHSPGTQQFYPSVGGHAGGSLPSGTSLLRAHKARVPPSSA